jgi:GT2 family glycosyltransferase
MKKVFACVLNYNGFKDTIECVESLLQSNYTNLSIVIIDNGSTDGSAFRLKNKFPSITLIESKENLGYAGGNNLGISWALREGADYIFILNNDTIVSYDCIERFVFWSEILKDNVLGGSVYTYEKKDELQHFGGVWDLKKGKFKNLPDENFSTDKIQELDFLTGCSLFIPRNVFLKTGLFEEAFFLYYEEIDWCFRARSLSFKLFFCPEPKIWHKESRSFAHPKPPQSYYQWRNRLLFVERNFSKSYFLFYLFWFLPKRAFILFIKFFLKSLTSPKSYDTKLSILAYQASFRGILDYFKRSFGKGPDWICKKIEK